MTRRPLLLALSLLLLAVPSKSLAEEARPNLIFIFTDDQRGDAVGYTGNLAVKTPHLDRLARNGVIFQNSFVNTSICAVNRANVLAGQYPGRHGIDDFFKVFGEQQLADSVPGRLQAAGYQTGFFGKWGIGDSPEKTYLGAAVFDYWAGQPMQTCFFHETDCRYVNFDGFDRPLDDLCDCPADARGKVGYRNRIGKANLKSPIHMDSQVVPAQVGRFLAGRDTDKPFALFLFLKGPHSPFADWDPAVEKTTEGLRMPPPPAATLHAAERVPPVVKTMHGRGGGMRYVRQPETLEQHQRDYLRLVNSLDLGVGRVMTGLDDAGVADNTVVMFTSDNGHFLGEHGVVEKWLMYEPSLRVPGFLYDPREEGGVTSTRSVITTDFSVTLLAYAGIEKPADMTGRDLRLLANDPRADWREDFFYDHPYGHGGRIPKTIGVRTERHTYTRYITTDPLQEELFDNHLDPNQLDNLVGDPTHAELLEKLRARCDELRAEVG